ncbi:MAG: peptide deformylase [Clostridia bacterium]|nr:peptide deformylase [Clostridia bacterium]
MAERTIVLKGDEVLGKRCRPVENFDERLQVLVNDMKDTLRAANGAGLAAPQVGVLRRLVIIDVGGGEQEDYRVFVNPEIIDQKGEQREIEGCLSCPNQWGITVRPAWAKVRAQDEKGEFFEMEGEGLLARAFCHELDHLDGILFEQRVTEWVEIKKEKKKK